MDDNISNLMQLLLEERNLSRKEAINNRERVEKIEVKLFKEYITSEMLEDFTVKLRNDISFECNATISKAREVYVKVVGEVNILNERVKDLRMEMNRINRRIESIKETEKKVTKKKINKTKK
jgi:hypothetical protein